MSNILEDEFKSAANNSPLGAGGFIRVGIIGGAGYTGGELIRLLINHPNATIAFVHSNSNAGNCVSKVHADLIGETDLRFSGNEALATESLATTDVLFLCTGHGEAKKFLEANAIPAHKTCRHFHVYLPSLRVVCQRFAIATHKLGQSDKPAIDICSTKRRNGHRMFGSTNCSCAVSGIRYALRRANGLCTRTSVRAFVGVGFTPARPNHVRLRERATLRSPRRLKAGAYKGCWMFA